MHPVIPRPIFYLAASLILFLTACGVQEPDTNLTKTSYIATIDISSSDTKTTLAKTYGGEVIVYEPEAGFAILKFSQAPSALGVANVEKNEGIFSVPESVDPKSIEIEDDRKDQLMAFSTQGGSAQAGGMSAWSNGMSSMVKWHVGLV